MDRRVSTGEYWNMLKEASEILGNVRGRLQQLQVTVQELELMITVDNDRSIRAVYREQREILTGIEKCLELHYTSYEDIPESAFAKVPQDVIDQHAHYRDVLYPKYMEGVRTGLAQQWELLFAWEKESQDFLEEMDFLFGDDMCMAAHLCAKEVKNEELRQRFLLEFDLMITRLALSSCREDMEKYYDPDGYLQIYEEKLLNAPHNADVLVLISWSMLTKDYSEAYYSVGTDILKTEISEETWNSHEKFWSYYRERRETDWERARANREELKKMHLIHVENSLLMTEDIKTVIDSLMDIVKQIMPKAVCSNPAKKRRVEKDDDMVVQ